MFESFDTLPILNWHNFLKSGNYAFFVMNQSHKNIYSQKQLSENYEKLIDSLGSRKLLNGHYAKALQSSILFNISKTPQNEQNYNNDFYAYINLLNETVEQTEIEGRKFYNLRDGYTHYFLVKGREHSIKYRLFEFNYNNFPDKIYDFNLFKDLAIVEKYLNRTLDPSIISVNHYNEIKKNAIETAQNEQSNRKK